MRAPTLPLAPAVCAEDPAPGVPQGARRLFGVLGLVAVTLLLTPLGLLLWAVYLCLRLGLPRPPLLAPPARYAHIARLLWRTEVPAPGLHPLDRLKLLVDLGLSFLLAPVQGLAWMVDELLYRRELAANPLVAPVFEVSAWRSGSTRLGHLLTEDPTLAAPGTLQMFVPYLWVWRLVRATLGRVVDPEAVRRSMRASLPPAFVERHEVDPWRTDTYDVLFYRHQLVPYAMALGPEVAAEEFSHRGVTPSTRALWEEDFVRMVDGLGRRTLAFRGGGGRFFLKGHFLAAAPALARRYPDASFLTVLREPRGRFRSTLNYLRLSPDFFGLGPMPWPWIAAMTPTEVAYSQNEQAWFSAPTGPRRCVLRFEELVNDLPAALERVYREGLGAEGPPAAVPRTHGPRHVGPYAVDHSLADLGVDEAALDEALAGYTAWCRAPGPGYRPASG